jgi:hypothetical protein
MATKKIKRFQEGGMSDKDRGLEASKDDKVGFFERLRMGNIDDEGSEAYRRFGAGRGKMERTPVEDRTPTPVIRKKPEGVTVTPLGEEPRNNAVISSPAVNKPRPQRLGKQSIDIQPEKPRPASLAPVKSSANPMTNPQPTTQTYVRNTGATAGGRTTPAKTGADAIPGQNVKPVVGEKIEPMSDAERNINNMMIGTGVGAGVFGLYKKGKSILNARKAAKAGAKKRAALKRDVEEGIDRNLADEFKDLASSAAKTPAKKTKATSKQSSYGSAREDAKADKAYKNLRDSDFTRSTRDDKTLNPMAWMSGPKGMADNFKKGGKVNSMKMSSGGSTSPASKRADGIASRGKTRCKIC